MPHDANAFHLPSPRQVVGGTDARRQLVAVAELDAELRDLIAVGIEAGRVGRHFLALGAEADVDGQPVVERPGVLDEEPDVVRVDVALGDEARGRVDVVAAHRVVAVLARSWRRVSWPSPSGCVTRGRSSPLSTSLPMRSTCTPNLIWCSPPPCRYVGAVGVEVRARLLIVIAGERGVASGCS